MAATAAAIPTVALFFVFQRQLVDSIKTSGFKLRRSGKFPAGEQHCWGSEPRRSRDVDQRERGKLE
jgi:hypothetical protein